MASALCEGRKPLTAASGRTDSGSSDSNAARVLCETSSPSLPAVGGWQVREQPPLLSAVEVSEMLEVVRSLLLPSSCHVMLRAPPVFHPLQERVAMSLMTYSLPFTLT